MKKLLARLWRGRRSQESRNAARYATDEAVEFHAWPEKAGQEKVLGYGRLVDVSEQGLQFTYSGRIRKGQTVRLHALEPEGSLLQFDPVVSVRWVGSGREYERVAGAECCAASQRRFSPFERAD